MAAPGYTLSGPAIAELRRMMQWWRRTHRAGGGGGPPKYPPLQSSTRLAWATTTAAVAPGDVSFNVNNVIPFDGSTWPGETPLYVRNCNYRIASGATGKIVYCYRSGMVGSSHNYDGTAGNDGWNWFPIDYSPICADGSSP